MKCTCLLFAVIFFLGAHAIPSSFDGSAKRPFWPRVDNGTASGTAIGGDINTIAIQIKDSTGALILNPGVDGNLFVADPKDYSNYASLVSGTQEFLADPSSLAIMSDNSSPNRYLYYYSAEMDTISVSRFRLAAWGKIPLGARLASLVPFKGTDGSNMLIAVDSTGQYFYPVVCAMTAALNKVFLVKDVSTGVSALQTNTDLKYILTGGTVDECGPLALGSDGLTGSY